VSHVIGEYLMHTVRDGDKHSVLNWTVVMRTQYLVCQMTSHHWQEYQTSAPSVIHQLKIQ